MAVGQTMSASHQNTLQTMFSRKGAWIPHDVSPSLPFPEHHNYMQKGSGEFHSSPHPSYGAAIRGGFGTDPAGGREVQIGTAHPTTAVQGL